MALMKFHKSTSQTDVLKIKQFVFILLGLLIVLVGCTKSEYPRPTKEYYVNDFANALHPLTRDNILFEAENMYEYTKDFEENGGTQIVFATFVVQNEEEVFSYNLDALFNQWRIGKNNMGVLVPMFFLESVEDGITNLNFYDAYIIPGRQMEIYLTPDVQENFKESILFGSYSDDLDVRVMFLLYELKAFIYDEAYDLFWEWDETDLDVFIEAKENYVSTDDDLTMASMSWLIFLLSPYSSFWDKILTIVPVALFFLIGSGAFIRRSGGGGRSGGFWIFRRR